jgi:peptidyl-prolyl cis-trans isomerase A (cyclophilin A)
MWRWLSTGCFLVSAFALAGCLPPDSTSKQPDPPVQVAESVERPAAHVKKPADAAPETFQVKFETTKGDFIVEVHRAWSPNGADRFHALVKNGFYDDCAFFRVLPGFMAQGGINGDPEVMAKWRDANIPDDRVVKSNERGYVTFAKSGAPNSRSTQFFINYADNSRLDDMGFSPFGQVIKGMKVVDSINAEYREEPDQQQIQYNGNAYLRKSFPQLDYIKTARVAEAGGAGE